MAYMPTQSHTPPRYDALFVRNHRPIDLVDAAIATLTTYTPEKKSQANDLEQSLEDFKRAIEIDIEKDMPSKATEKITNTFAKKLGDVFFLNSLKDVKYTWDPEEEGDVHVFGVHAMLAKFSCDNQVCASSECRDIRGYESGGDLGQGLAFHKMAKEVEKSSAWYFRVKLDLGRQSPANVDWRARDMATPENVALYFDGKCPFTGDVYNTEPPYNLLQKGEKPKDPKEG
ncbi:hypothetical protein HII31_07487 [Pseudocercospora fuligena]|uniref:Uncharacterized protein n=1 Tax=Pseudocercospora fuligena TaxID=685502 RepID=A0A8H6VHW8_9PEZI|nr:hypothetical protein HII31_07487 [Pseudocercospora fuligena]